MRERVSGVRRMSLAAAALTLAAAWPLAAQSRVVVDSVAAPVVLANATGTPTTRAVSIYLPPSYAREPTRRYPVLYFLHGFTSHPVEWLDGSYGDLNLQTAMDSLIAAGMPEFLVVMPDAFDALGGSFYVNSAAAGRWETFIASDLVRAVDRRYRTDARASRRAIAGHSVGGFGALTIGLGHPEQFGMVYAMSPCCTGFVGEMAPESPTWARLATVTRWQDVPAGPRMRMAIAVAASLSPDPRRPQRFGRLPFEAEASGALVPVPAVMAQWRAAMPAGRAAALVRSGKRRPKLLIDAGDADEVASVGPGVASLRRALDSLGVAYTAEIYSGGHVDRQRARISGHLLPAVGAWVRPTAR